MATPATTGEWRTIRDANGKPAYDQYVPSLQKSQTDNREYRYIRLPNRLEALLVSDPETDKSAAALDVNVGHLSDPVSTLEKSYDMDHTDTVCLG